MRVYHGSNVIVKNPDIEHSFRPLDFGKGFYVTTVREQAERWARRKADIFGTNKGIINVYQMKADFTKLRYKCFEDDLNEWIAFITQRAIDQLLCYESFYEVV